MAAVDPDWSGSAGLVSLEQVASLLDTLRERRPHLEALQEELEIYGPAPRKKPPDYLPTCTDAGTVYELAGCYFFDDASEWQAFLAEVIRDFVRDVLARAAVIAALSRSCGGVVTSGVVEEAIKYRGLGDSSNSASSEEVTDQFRGDLEFGRVIRLSNSYLNKLRDYMLRFNVPDVLASGMTRVGTKDDSVIAFEDGSRLDMAQTNSDPTCERALEYVRQECGEKDEDTSDEDFAPSVTTSEEKFGEGAPLDTVVDSDSPAHDSDEVSESHPDCDRTDTTEAPPVPECEYADRVLILRDRRPNLFIGFPSEYPDHEIDPITCKFRKRSFAEYMAIEAANEKRRASLEREAKRRKGEKLLKPSQTIFYKRCDWEMAMALWNRGA